MGAAEPPAATDSAVSAAAAAPADAVDDGAAAAPASASTEPYIQSSPYFYPTYTRTGWIGQPPILNRHEVVTIDGDVDMLRQATP